MVICSPPTHDRFYAKLIPSGALCRIPALGQGSGQAIPSPLAAPRSRVPTCPFNAPLTSRFRIGPSRPGT